MVLVIFWSLWHNPALKGAFIHRTFFFYYLFYFAINLWHLLGRITFPETFAASHYFAFLASNIVFVLLVGTIWILAILKFIDNHRDGGLMGVYERNIDKWRKLFGGGDPAP